MVLPIGDGFRVTKLERSWVKYHFESPANKGVTCSNLHAGPTAYAALNGITGQRTDRESRAHDGTDEREVLLPALPALSTFGSQRRMSTASRLIFLTSPLSRVVSAVRR